MERRLDAFLTETGVTTNAYLASLLLGKIRSIKRSGIASKIFSKPWSLDMILDVLQVTGTYVTVPGQRTTQEESEAWITHTSHAILPLQYNVKIS